MKTSLHEIKETEDFISGNMKPEESLLFNARLLLDTVLKTNVSVQKYLYRLICLYGRKRLKDEIEEIHAQLFNDPARSDFRNAIHQLFSKS